MQRTEQLVPTAVPAVRMRGVCKAFGKVRIFNNLDLDIAPGAKVAIIGRSGSGKTTVLRIIMTLEKHDAGTVEVFGRLVSPSRVENRLVRDDLANIRKVRADIGMVFQQFNLF